MGLEEQLEALYADQGGSAEEDGLLHDEITDAEELRAGEKGANVTWRVVLAGSLDRAYFKPLNGVNGTLADMFGLARWEVPLCECAAWRVADGLGSPWRDMVSPCVVRQIDSIDSDAPGSLSAERFGDDLEQPWALLDVPDACLQAAFFDAVVGNMDRELWNVRHDRGRRDLALIDHGFAFADENGLVSESVFLAWRHNVGRAGLDAYEVEALDRILNADMFGVRRYLGEARAAQLQRRVERMRATGRLLPTGEICP